jgi:hypothetical protein
MQHVMAFVIGYMLSDLAMGRLVPGLLDKEMVIHHFMITAFFVWALTSNLTVAFQVLFLVNEVSRAC